MVQDVRRERAAAPVEELVVPVETKHGAVARQAAATFLLARRRGNAHGQTLGFFLLFVLIILYILSSEGHLSHCARNVAPPQYPSTWAMAVVL